MNKQAKIELIGCGLIASFVLSMLLISLKAYQHQFQLAILDILLSNNYYLSTFGDFEQVYHVMQDNSPYIRGDNSFPVPYFPFAFVIAKFFSFFPQRLSVYLFIFLFIGVFLALSYNQLKDSFSKFKSITTVLIFSFLSYPFLFALQRGNYESIVFIWIALFVFTYAQSKWQGLNHISLACAIAMKAFPALFLVLYFFDKRYKSIFIVLSYVVLFTLFGYAVLDGGIVQNIKAQQTALAHYNAHYAIGNMGLLFGHSLYGAFKSIILIFAKSDSQSLINSLYTYMPIVALIFFRSMAFYLKVSEIPFWKKIALLVFSICLLPHVSNDYKLLLVFLPLYLFINEKESSPYDFIYSILFILILIPKASLLPLSTGDYVNLGAIVTPFVMFFTSLIIVGESLARNPLVVPRLLR